MSCGWLTVCWDSGNLMANCLSLSSKLALAYSHSGWATFQENELKHARSLETYVSSTACYLSKVKDPAWIQGVTKASILCRKTQEVPLQIWVMIGKGITSTIFFQAIYHFMLLNIYVTFYIWQNILKCAVYRL